MGLEPPWEKTLKPRHRRQEEKIEELGGERHPASGRIWRWKRDGHLFDFLIEARDTQADSYRISYQELQDITKEAYGSPPGFLPAMYLTIKDSEWMLIPRSAFVEIYNELVRVREHWPE